MFTALKTPIVFPEGTALKTRDMVITNMKHFKMVNGVVSRILDNDLVVPYIPLMQRIDTIL